MSKIYSDEQLLSLIAQVETEFQAHLEKTMAKDSVVENTESVDSEEKEIEALYGSMEKSEAEMHYKALKKTLFVEETKEEQAEAQVQKSEEKTETVVEVKTEKEEDSIIKSEMEAIKKENEELKKNISQIVSVIKKSAEAPKRKAVTNIEWIKKSESEGTVSVEQKDVSSLTKSEIDSKIKEKIRTGKLEKKDKDAVLEYYNSAKPNVESIKHLL